MLRKTSKALIIFVKNPLAGKVKTRLAIDSSNEYALKVYQALLQHTRLVTGAIDATRYVYYSEHIPEVDDWEEELYNKRIQSPGGLGVKMQESIQDALKSHEKVIIIGSDCIQLTVEDINLAFEELDRFDTVVGPALDGGYYLLGMKNNMPQIFANIPWSTDQVAEKTLQAIISSGYSSHFLRPLSDIDYLDDWKRFGYPL